MWKVMIADDEPKILRGLAGMLRGMPLDLEVAGMASDGALALEMARELQPDIMLVDICMPFLNGLELIERLQEMRQDMKIIVVTGYEEFEYARKALEMMVQAYLLKPVGAHELQRKLEEAITELSSQREYRKHYAFAMEQLRKRKDMLIEDFWKDVLAGEYVKTEILQRCEWFGIDCSNGYDLFLIAPLMDAAGMKPEQELLLRYEMEGALKQELERLRESYLFSDHRGNIVILCGQDSFDQPGLADTVACKLKQEIGLTVHVEQARLPNIQSLPEIYDQTVEALFDTTGVSPMVAMAQSYIAKNYAKPDLGLPEVAEKVGVTPTYLSRLMKQELGMSFSKHLNMTRTKHAILLMEKGMMLKDIAARVGYSSPYYFSTAFKKTLGIPPNEYRSEVVKK